jgi:hypothetical protein
MDIGAVLRRAWQITWKHKAFWVLGILASCSGGGGGGGSTSGQAGSSYQFQSGEFPQIERFFNSIPEATLAAAGLALLCLGLILVVLFVAAGVIGQGGLVAAFHRADEGQAPSLGEAFQLGLRYFWRLLGIQILLVLLAIVAVSIFGVSGVVATTLTLGLAALCLIPLACLLIPAMFVFGVYSMLAQVAAVVEDLDILSAFRRAWEVLRANIGPVVLMALILVVGGALVGLITALPIVFIVFPGVVGVTLGGERATTAGVLVSGLCFLAYIPVLIVVNGILQTFVAGSWTITFRRLTGKQGLVEEPVPEPQPV